MSSSFEIDRPYRFTAGAVGDPGQRVFYLQATSDDATVTLKVEKQQVAALCEYLAGILADLPPATTEQVGSLELVEPAVEEWAIGGLAVAYEQDDDCILLVAEELVEVDDDGDPVAVPATARFYLGRPQVAAFIEHGIDLVRAGRPSCRYCMRPMDPTGHICPRLN